MAEEIDELLGLGCKIDHFEDTSLTNGENAFIIYLEIDNKTGSSRKINLSKAPYVTSKREQLEQDIWISGYIIGEDVLKPNSFKKAGLVFYKSKLKAICENDLVYISLELNKEGTALTICFQRVGNNWVLINKEKAEIEIKLSPKQIEKNLLKHIERLEAFEDRLEIYLDKISLKVNEDLSFKILGEVHSKNGTGIEENFKIYCVLYDTENSILEQQSQYILKSSFFGFQIFELNFFDAGISALVNSLRIYPQK